jgi:sialic acid synthase SpsE
VANGHAPYFIAEIGSNHNQDMDQARRLIDVAAEAGADAVKVQMFSADALYPKEHEMHAVFKAMELDPDWLAPLAAHAADRGMAFFGSAFDRVSVDRLDENGAPAFKVASSEATKTDLLAYMAAKGKPLFLATGMCDMVDVLEAVDTCQRSGNHQVAVMQCAALYPLEPKDANLNVMTLYRDLFGAPVGFSDHSMTHSATLAAVALGASVIEKHITLDCKASGPDHFYAVEPEALKTLLVMIRDVHAALGSRDKQMHALERQYGRRDGLYAARAIRAGTRLTRDDIEIKRPALGIRGRHADAAPGMVAAVDIAEGAPLEWKDLTP